MAKTVKITERRGKLFQLVDARDVREQLWSERAIVYWPKTMGTVTADVRKLVEAGLVEPVGELLGSPGYKARSTQLTSAGREALATWTTEKVEG
jgi:DNA-binding PadR family transcriptional regulator